MEGTQKDIQEVEPIDVKKIPKKNIKDFKNEIQIIFMIALIIGLIIGSMIWFMILQPKPIYQQYEKKDEDPNTIYENNDLNVRIIESPDNLSSKDYQLEWTNIYGEEESHFSYSKDPEIFLDNTVLLYAYRLSVEQIKWFEFMRKNVL
jgi:hypothetical protein